MEKLSANFEMHKDIAAEGGVALQCESTGKVFIENVTLVDFINHIRIQLQDIYFRMLKALKETASRRRKTSNKVIRGIGKIDKIRFEGTKIMKQ